MKTLMRIFSMRPLRALTPPLKEIDASSTCSGNSRSSHTSSSNVAQHSAHCAPEENIDESSLRLQDVVDLAHNKCGVAKVKGDWHQRICSIRGFCRYFEDNAFAFCGSYFETTSLAAMTLMKTSIASMPCASLSARSPKSRSYLQLQTTGAEVLAARAKSLCLCI